MNRVREEKGQAVFLAAGLLFLFLVIAAVVMDIGWWLHDKRDAQNDVDAAVLAGAQDLPVRDAAEWAAETWAADNGAGDDLITPCDFKHMPPGTEGPYNWIRCTVKRDPGRLEKGLVDIEPFNITASAAAAKMKAVAACVMPMAVIGDPVQGPLATPPGHWGLTPQALYIFHTSDFTTPGNFGALALYGNGAIDYKEGITTPCGTGTVGACDQTDPQVPVGETLQCEVKTGNMGQNTNDALKDRDANFGAGAFCDVTTYGQAFEMIYSPPPGAENCAAARAVLIPIIVAWPPQGHSGDVQILGLATFYIANWDRKPPYGNVDVDGDTVEDDAMVWGYFLENVPVIPAWKITWGYSPDPFAPIITLLVE
jgi:hypothetical protein